MLKRLFDITVAATGLLVLSPLLIVISVCVLVSFGRPILFLQTRPGRGGKPFVIYKFRSMYNAVDAAGEELSDAQRLSRFGAFLRSTSLDELPELFNVLIGDMSLVGPRPLLMEYLPLYSPEQARRHEVRPGITGWAQIKGRNRLSWEERFALDVWYVDNRTFFLDFRILWLTLAKVVKREGISHPGDQTMPRFKGNSKVS